MLALHALVPARAVEGYVRDANGKRLRYRLNGLRVFALAIAAWAGACCAGAAVGP